MTVAEGPLNGYRIQEVASGDQTRVAGNSKIGVEEHEHPLVGPYRQARHPIQFEATSARVRRDAPALGADTDKILREFGLID